MERIDTGDFDPDATNVDMPELNQLDFDLFFVEKFDLPTQVEDSTIVGDDECSVRWDMQLSEYMKLFQEGTNSYLKYEDGEPFQEKLHSVIGSEAIEAFDERLIDIGSIKHEKMKDVGHFG